MEIFKLVGSIVVDDSQAKQSIGNIKGEASGLSGVFQKAGGAVGGFISSIGKIATTFGVFKALDGLVNMITGSVSSAINRFDVLQNSERVFQNMGFEAGETEKMMDNLIESITGLPTPLEDAVKGVQTLASSTGDLEGSEEIYSALNNAVLGFGGSNEDVNRTVTMLSRSLQKGVIQGDEWNTMMDTMGPVMNAVAEEMGYTTDQLREGLSNGSIDINEFTDTLLRMNEEGGGGLVSLEQIAKDATAGIGTALENVQNAFNRGMESIIESTNEALVENGLPEIHEIITLFGSTAEEVMNRFAEIIPDIIGWIAEFKEGLADGFDGEGFNLDGITNKIQEFLPILVEKGKEIFNSLIQGVLDNLPMITGVVVDLINGFITNLGEKYAILIPAGMEILVALIDGLIQALPLIMSVAFQTIGTLVETIMGLLPTIIDAGMTLLTALIDGIVNNLPALVSMALTLTMFIVDSLMSQLPAIIDAGITIINALVDGLIEMMPVLVPMAMEIINTLLGAILQNLPVIIQAGIQLLVALINGIVSMLPMLVAQGINLIISLIGSIISNLPLLISAGIQVLIALISGIIQTIPQLISTALQLPGYIIAGFAEVDWLGIGKDIINGIIDGIMGMGSALLEAGKNVVSSAFNGVKNFLGIASPSKLFRDEVGKWIPAGIAVGIEENSELPLDALNKVIGVEGYDMSGTVRHMNGNRDGENRRFGGDVKQNITIHSPRPLDPIESARQIKKASRQLALEH